MKAETVLFKKTLREFLDRARDLKIPVVVSFTDTEEEDVIGVAYAGTSDQAVDMLARAHRSLTVAKKTINVKLAQGTTALPAEKVLIAGGGS